MRWQRIASWVAIATTSLLCTACHPSDRGSSSVAPPPHAGAPVAPVTIRPNDLAIVGGTVYVAPDMPSILDGVVVVSEGKVAAVGKRGAVDIAGMAVFDAAGATVTSGFQNRSPTLPCSRATPWPTFAILRACAPPCAPEPLSTSVRVARS